MEEDNEHRLQSFLNNSSESCCVWNLNTSQKIPSVIKEINEVTDQLKESYDIKNTRLKNENTQLKDENTQLKDENTQLKDEKNQLENDNKTLQNENTQLKRRVESQNRCNVNLSAENDRCKKFLLLIVFVLLILLYRFRQPQPLSNLVHEKNDSEKIKLEECSTLLKQKDDIINKQTEEKRKTESKYFDCDEDRKNLRTEYERLTSDVKTQKENIYTNPWSVGLFAVGTFLGMLLSLIINGFDIKRRVLDICFGYD